ncbi:calpain-2 catalytic subunit-like [Diretmus argenteus]
MSNVANSLIGRNAKKEDAAGSVTNPIPFNRQDFNALKSKCLQTGTLFYDLTFPTNWNALGYDELGPNSPKTAGVVWKRPTELTFNPKFVTDGIKKTDICQGALGDCWLLAALNSLTLDKELLGRVVPNDQRFDENYAGIFHFRLWQYGEWVDVVVDDRLPTKDGKLLFVHSEESNEFWSALLEKAYAKVCSSYEALSGGAITEGFEDLSGGITETYNLKEPPRHLFQLMQKALKQSNLLGCAIDIQSADEFEEITPDRLVKSHAYSITGAAEVHFRGSPVPLVRMRNPWGFVEWIGPWSDRSRMWDQVPLEEKLKLDRQAEDGEFCCVVFKTDLLYFLLSLLVAITTSRMSFQDYLRHFSKMDVCCTTPDALTSNTTSQWSSSQFEGFWRVGSTAGGCINYQDTFSNNPQFAFRLENVDVDPLDGEDGCTVLIGLMQKDRRREKRFGLELNNIGFAIFKVPDELKGRRNVHLGPEVLRGTPVAQSKSFTNLREVCERFKLPVGEYVIVPSTFLPHVKGSFILRVFTEIKVDVSALDEEIMDDMEIEDLRTFSSQPAVEEINIDPHFKYLFSQISGISNGSDKLNLVEFHDVWTRIQGYLRIFKNNDLDRSGTMKAKEMRNALTEAGFQVNTAVLQEVVAQYSDNKHNINFDNFVGCVIRMELLFSEFPQNTRQAGSPLTRTLTRTLTRLLTGPLTRTLTRTLTRPLTGTLTRTLITLLTGPLTGSLTGSLTGTPDQDP